MIMRSGLCGAVSGVAMVVALTTAVPAGAETLPKRGDYPTQTVRLIVPFSSGGITDSLARIVAHDLGQVWQQSVVVENRPGLPGTASVAASAPDGYTLIMTSNGHAIARAISKNVSFDPVNDFAGVIRVADVPFVMNAATSLPAKTLKEFIDLAKAQPGKFNFASSGVASSVFLAAETFRQAAGLDLVHVPFRGSPDAVTAVLRGDVAFYFQNVLAAVELGAAGKIRALGITSSKRAEQLPDVPSIVEVVPKFSYSSWFGILAPEKTPREIITKVNGDVKDLLKRSDVNARLKNLGVLPAPNTPEEQDAMIRTDAASYAQLLKAANVEAK